MSEGNGTLKLSELDSARFQAAHWRYRASAEFANRLAHEAKAARARAEKAIKAMEEERAKLFEEAAKMGIDTTKAFEVAEDGVVSYQEPVKVCGSETSAS